MLYLIRLAFRNIRRNRRRSMLAVISVALSLMIIVFLKGMVDGMNDSIIKNSTKNETGHIRITTKEFNEKIHFMPVTENIADPDGLIALIQSDPKISNEVSLITERIYFPILLQYSGNNKSAVVVAGDIEKEKQLLMLNKSIKKGKYLDDQAVDESGKKVREIIMGKNIADILEMGVSNTTTVMLQGSDYSIHIPTLKLVGIFQTGINSLDDSIFQMSLKDAKEVLHTSGGSQQIIIMLKDYRKSDAVAALIQAKLDQSEVFKGMAVTPWLKAGGMAAFMQQAMKIYNFIYFVVAFLGALIITNIMMMVVLERRKEIGIMKSMGFSRPEILILFLFEGIALGTVGSISGVVLGVLSSLYFVFQGIDFTTVMSSLTFPMDNVIKFSLSVPGIIAMMLLGIIVASLVSILPSRQAAKMNAVDAIKSV